VGKRVGGVVSVDMCFLSVLFGNKIRLNLCYVSSMLTVSVSVYHDIHKALLPNPLE
jgi:hypothetical protein